MFLCSNGKVLTLPGSTKLHNRTHAEARYGSSHCFSLTSDHVSGVFIYSSEPSLLYRHVLSVKTELKTLKN